MPAVIVTRAQPGAWATAERIRALGLQPIVSPALSLERVDPPPEIPRAGVQAIVFTSANGVRFFTQVSDIRDLKAWCVGPSTQAAAQAAGFFEAESAEGDSTDLARLIMCKASPADGLLVHVANTAAGDVLHSALRAAGFEVNFIGLYAPRQMPKLTLAAEEALKRETPVSVLIHSAKGAEGFANLVEGMALPPLRIFAVSDKAAKPVSHLGEVHTAARPNEDSLLNLISEWHLAL